MARFPLWFVAVPVLLALPATAWPQAAERPGAVVTGRVLDALTSSPITGAIVMVEGTSLRSVSDSAGAYRLARVPPGPQMLVVRRIGYSPSRMALTVPSRGTLAVDVVMAVAPLQVQTLIVTADPSGRARGELGTASVIDREAIANQTAASLAGVLELLPGIALAPPGLDNVQQIPLRAVATSAGASLVTGGPSAADLASFGTLIILDGVPVSNNANLQTTGPRGELQSLLPSSAGGGIDVRRIPAATIDRVEVIRGVPSARYGDLTQGVIVVDTRAGVVEPTVATRYDPRSIEASLVGGRQVGGARHTLTANLDLANTRVAPGLRDDNAYRVTTQLAHRASIGGSREAAPGEAPLLLDSRIDFFQVHQDNPEDPEVFPGRASWNRDRGIRLSERARLALGGGARIELTASLDHTSQRSYAQFLLVRGAMPFTDRLEEGRAVGRYVGGEFLSRLWLEGDARQLYARLEGEIPARLLGLEQRIRVGAEARREWNSGPGYRFGIEFPPQVTFNGVQGFDRPRRFDAIPPVATSAVYLDDRLLGLLPGGVALELQAGLRADLLHRGTSWGSSPRDIVAQPRFNAQLMPWTWLRLRGAVGRAAKQPSLAALFPPRQFFDVVNVNWFANDPAERLAVLTTFIRDPSNPALGFSTARRAEAGIEVAPGRSGPAISLVAFTDRTTGGVGLRSRPGFLLRQRFDFADSAQGTGRPPALIEPPTRADTVPILVDQPANNLTLESSGFEVSATLPEIGPLRTRLEVQAAWVRTRFFKDDLDFGRGFSEFQLDERIPRVPYWESVTRTGERAMVTYRLIHHQPELGLVVTGVLQHIFREVRQDVAGADSLAFAGYITRSGRLVPVAPAERGNPEFADLRLPRAGTFIEPTVTPSDWIMSVQVSKMLPLQGRLSFYAFNVLDRLGRFSRSGFSSRSFPPLRFGLEVTMPLGGVFSPTQRAR